MRLAMLAALVMLPSTAMAQGIDANGWTLTNPILAGPLQGTEAAAPATPAAGKVVLYAKTGAPGVFCSKDDAGVESCMGGGGGGGLTNPLTSNLDANGYTISNATRVNGIFYPRNGAEIQAAIDACGEGSATTGIGCTIQLPRGDINISSTIRVGGLTLTTVQHGIVMRGHGSGIQNSNAPPQNTTGTTLVWTGADGGRVMEISGFGHDFQNFNIDGGWEGGVDTGGAAWGIVTTGDNDQSAPTGKNLFRSIGIDRVRGWGFAIGDGVTGTTPGNDQNDHTSLEQVRIHRSIGCLLQDDAQAVQNVVNQFECTFFTGPRGVYLETGGLVINDYYIGTVSAGAWAGAANAIGIDVESCAVEYDFTRGSFEIETDNFTGIRDDGSACGSGNYYSSSIESNRIQFQNTASVGHTCLRLATNRNVIVSGNAWHSNNADALRRCDLEFHNPSTTIDSQIIMSGNTVNWNNFVPTPDVVITVTAAGAAKKRVFRTDNGRVEYRDEDGSTAMMKDESGLFVDVANNGTFDSGTDIRLNGEKSVEVSLALSGGAGFFSTTVTGQAWVTSGSEIVCKPFGTTADGLTPESIAVGELSLSISDRVVGTGFNLNVYSPHGLEGTIRAHCVGV